MLVYSNSPNWQEYIETYIIPEMPVSTDVLNRSEHATWRSLSLSVLAFRHLGRSRKFNPLVVVFHAFRRTNTYRFLKPFRNFKQGKNALLEQLQSRLFQLLSQTGAVQTDERGTVD